MTIYVYLLRASADTLPLHPQHPMALSGHMTDLHIALKQALAAANRGRPFVFTFIDALQKAPKCLSKSDRIINTWLVHINFLKRRAKAMVLFKHPTKLLEVVEPMPA